MIPVLKKYPKWLIARFGAPAALYQTSSKRQNLDPGLKKP